jgi:hypothetical protein
MDGQHGQESICQRHGHEARPDEAIGLVRVERSVSSVGLKNVLQNQIRFKSCNYVDVGGGVARACRPSSQSPGQMGLQIGEEFICGVECVPSILVGPVRCKVR